MRVAVTGARGYAGSHIVEGIERRGHEVVELVRRFSPNAIRHQLIFDLREGISVESLRGEGIEALVHVAYDFRPTTYEEIRRVNYEGTVRLLEAFGAAGGRRAVYISTVASYEGCRSHYGRVKLETEKAALSRGYWVVRPGLIRGGTPGGIVGTMLRLVKKLPVVPIIGYNVKCLYPVHSDELSCIVAQLIEQPPKDTEEALVIAAHPEALSLDDVVRDMIRSFRLKPRLLIPVPWQAAWFGLRTIERFGLFVGLRSDSVISLMNQDPHPPFRDLSVWTRNRE